MNKAAICPKCGRKYIGEPALSREDNKTSICPDCGLREALMEYKKYLGEVKKYVTG